MEHSEGRFNGCRDFSLYYQKWLPENDPKAILVISHGLAEHSGRYASLASYFVSRGYAVYALDYQGHGKSGGLRGYVAQFSDFSDDLKTFVDIVRNEQRGRKIFLFGHSVGGTIAIAYTAAHQADLAGLLLSAPTVKVGSSVSRGDIAMGRTLAKLLPKKGIAVIDATAISHDEAVVDAYVNDPLVYRGKISARLGVELINTMERELPRRLPEIKLPILIMYGTADRLSNPAGSTLLYGMVGSEDKTLKRYAGLYHEILNEPERRQVLADMEAWLAAHV